MGDVLSMWTVYDRPSDFPTSIVARRWEIRGGDAKATQDIIVGGTLELVRDALPPGLTRLDRNLDDEAQIVETWL